MRKLTPFLLLSCVLFALISCQKEKSLDSSGGKSGAGYAEVGTWKLLFIRSTASQSIIISDRINETKDVTIRDFTSTDNGGTLKFTGSTMTTTGLTFTIDGIAKTYFYINGSVDDSLETPFAAILPPANLADGYKKISPDSLNFQTGVLSAIISGGTQTIPTGYKLTFDGDKMIMTSAYNNSKRTFISGATQWVVDQEVTDIVLQKQ
ncbi:MAG TPA: hypothetical protein VF008_01120 [Niastella sp.]